MKRRSSWKKRSMAAVLIFAITLCLLPGNLWVEASELTPEEVSLSLYDIWTNGSKWTSKPTDDSWNLAPNEVYNYAENSDIKTTSLPESSTAGIKYADNGSGSSYQYYEVLAELPAGEYVLSTFLMGDDSKLKLYIGDEMDTTEYATTGWNNWTEAKKTFTVTEKQTNVKVGFQLDVSKSGWGYIDQLYLQGTASKADTSTKTKEELNALLAKIPSDYETAYTTDTTDALKSAMEAANAETIEDINTVYNNLENAINGLVYQDNDIIVKKVNGISADFIKGVDVSSYITLVNSGVKYYDFEGNELDSTGFFKLFAEQGVNYIRLRVWNNPMNASGAYYGGGNNDIATTVEICKAIQKYNTTYDDNMKVLIDFHYSDFWVDPDKQNAPKAWADYTIGDDSVTKLESYLAQYKENGTLADAGTDKLLALAKYTIESLQTIKETGVTIGMVQIGNETNNGICGESVANGYTNVYRVFKAGCDAVAAFDEKEAEGEILKAVHFTDPQNQEFQKNWAVNLLKNDVNYDVFATSFYPYWHGTTSDLGTSLAAIAKETRKKVMVAETQEIYTNSDYDGFDNQAYEGKNNIDTSVYAVSVQGQANEFRDVINAVASVGEAGIGVFYWEPAWLPVGNAYNADGSKNASAYAANEKIWNTQGSGWATAAAGEYDDSVNKWGYGGTNCENAALFDFTGHPLATLKVFKYVDRGALGASEQYYSYELDTDKIEKDFPVKVGMSVEEIEAQLPDTATITYNTGNIKSGCAVIWDSACLQNLAGKIATNTVVGNIYTVTGQITDPVSNNVKMVSTTVQVYPAENFIANGDFESGDEKWNKVSEPSYAWIGALNVRGNYGIVINTYDAEAGKVSLAAMTQEVTITEPGVYGLTGFAEGADKAGSEDGESIYIKVTDANSKEYKSNLLVLQGWMNWQKAQINGIRITQDMIDNGEGKILVSVEANLFDDKWGSWDDIYLYKTGEITSGGSAGGSSTGTTTPTVPEEEKPDKNTEVTTNPDGSTTEKIVIAEIATGTTATVEVVKNEAGEVQTAKADVTKVITKGNKAVLSGAVVDQLQDAAGQSDLTVTMTVKDSEGKTKYSVQADAEDLTAGNKLYLYEINAKTGKLVMVNAKTYKVSKAGSVSVSSTQKAAYQLVSADEAKAINKAILKTVEPKKTSATVKKGKKTALSLSSKLDKDNVKTITYVSSKKSVATVSKTGKITAKKAGTAVVKAKVTLKNGSTKTVTMKIKVK